MMLYRYINLIMVISRLFKKGFLKVVYLSDNQLFNNYNKMLCSETPPHVSISISLTNANLHKFH